RDIPAASEFGHEITRAVPLGPRGPRCHYLHAGDRLRRSVDGERYPTRVSFSHVRAGASDRHHRWSPYDDRADGHQLGRLVGAPRRGGRLARLSWLLLDAVDLHAPRP